MDEINVSSPDHGQCLPICFSFIYLVEVMLMLCKSEKNLMLIMNFTIIVAPSWFCSELKLTEETMLKIGSDM